MLLLSLLSLTSSWPDGCKRLCGWLSVYLDGDDLFLRALLPGFNVSSSRLGADMPRHENYHAHTRAHFLPHTPCLSLGRSICVCITGGPALVCQRVSVTDLKVLSVDTEQLPPSPPAWLLLFVQLSTCTRRPATPHKRVYMHLFFYHCVTTSRIASFFVSSIKICRWIIIHSRY